MISGNSIDVLFYMSFQILYFILKISLIIHIEEITYLYDNFTKI